jgi:hypothetical protein
MVISSVQVHRQENSNTKIALKSFATLNESYYPYLRIGEDEHENNGEDLQTTRQNCQIQHTSEIACLQRAVAHILHNKYKEKSRQGTTTDKSERQCRDNEHEHPPAMPSMEHIDITRVLEEKENPFDMHRQQIQ